MTDLSKLFGGSLYGDEQTMRRALKVLEEPVYMRAARELDQMYHSGIAGHLRSDALRYGAAGLAATSTLAAIGTTPHQSIVGAVAAGILPYERVLPHLDPAAISGFPLYRFGTLAGGTPPIYEVARMARWAGALDSSALSQIEHMMSASSLAAKEIQQIQTARDQVLAVTRQPEFLAAYAMAEEARQLSITAELEVTRLKLSTFASALDVLGPLSAASTISFDALLGRYHTTPDLPPEFWRRREARVEIYREAEVDQGLIEADNADAIEVLIDSGFAGQLVRPSGRPTALVTVGMFTMRISTRHTRHDAYALIDTFEVNLRALITAKLEAVAGPKWFKQRVPEGIRTKSRERLEVAFRDGEPRAPLIDFTDLGELVSIITRRDNWEEAFEEVFVNRDSLMHDMMRVVATRRPTAHARGIDAVRLVEVVCVVERLQGMIDGRARKLRYDDED